MYFAFKADLKARKECNNFKEHYGCKRMCDRCAAVQPFTSAPVAWTYKDFSPSARYATSLRDHDMYLQRTRLSDVSPWTAVAGWRLETVSFDVMHVVQLGVARDLIPSCLRLLRLLGHGYTDGESDDEFLRRFSIEMNHTCKLQGSPSSR